MRVGFVGVGAMGTPMTRLLLPEHRVRVFDPDAARVAQLVFEGAEGAASAAEAASDAEVVIVMVATPEQLERAVFGDGGAGETLAPGSILILMSSVGTDAAVSAADRLAARGVRFVDAPVTGGVARAITGELTILAGADPEDLAPVLPLLRLLSARVARCGDRVGDGQAVKLVNQLLCSVHLVAAGEALAFAERLGLDPARVLEIVETGAASSFMLSDRGPRMLATETPAVRSAIDIFVKDSSLVLAAGTEAGAVTPLTRTAHDIFTRAREAGYGRADDSAVIHMFERKDAR